MALENVENETDLYYVDGRYVFKRPVVEARESDNQLTGRTLLGFQVCECPEDLEGAAEQIARALNRLPKAEAILVDVAAQIRAGSPAQPLADAIEEWMVNG